MYPYVDRTLEIGIDIISLPDELLPQIQQSVEKEKSNMEKWLILKNHKWCDQPGIIDYHSLLVQFMEGQPTEYKIITVFHDAEDTSFEGIAETIIDLSEHDAEFKRIISDFLFNEFFK